MTIAERKPANGKEAHMEPIRPDTYHGVPVLNLHVDDPIPSPRAPQRFAVRVHPDLARYLLTKNHPQNRPKKPSAVIKYARDMDNGYWAFTPESVVFSSGGTLQNGQNRLYAVELSGAPTWLMFDFGWPDDLIAAIDRGSARTNSDALRIDSVANASIVAGGVSIASRYHLTVGQPNRWTGRPLTAAETAVTYLADPVRWDTAARMGHRVYSAVQGLGPSTWAAAYFLIAEVRGNEMADIFIGEVADETGEPGSATRKLKSHYLRRRLSDTASGDAREPIENIIRAFNAFALDRPVGFVRTAGPFILSAVRKP